MLYHLCLSVCLFTSVCLSVSLFTSVCLFTSVFLAVSLFTSVYLSVVLDVSLVSWWLRPHGKSQVTACLWKFNGRKRSLSIKLINNSAALLDSAASCNTSPPPPSLPPPLLVLWNLYGFSHLDFDISACHDESTADVHYWFVHCPYCPMITVLISLHKQHASPSSSSSLIGWLIALFR